VRCDRRSRCTSWPAQLLLRARPMSWAGVHGLVLLTLAFSVAEEVSIELFNDDSEFKNYFPKMGSRTTT